MKSDQIILGSIEDSLSKNIISKPLKKQIQNLTYIKNYEFICFTSDEKLQNNNNNYITDNNTDKNEIMMNSTQKEKTEAIDPNSNKNFFCILNIWDKNLNEICSYSLDKLNETCHCFRILDLYENKDKKQRDSNDIDNAANDTISPQTTRKAKEYEIDIDTEIAVTNRKSNENNERDCSQAEKTLLSLSETQNTIANNYSNNSYNNNLSPLIFILGTSIYDKIDEDPKNGYIIILEFTKQFRFNKLFEIEVNYPIYKLNYIDNYLLTASNTTILAYKFNLRNRKSQEIIDLSNKTQRSNFKNLYYELNSYSENFSIDLQEIRKCNEFNFIYDFICDKDFIIVSDINKSVCLYKFDREKEKLNELCKDSNPMFCVSIAKSSRNIYTVCDFNANVYKMRKDMYPKDDAEKHK